MATKNWVYVGVSFEPELLEKLDAYVASIPSDRSKIIRQAVKKLLEEKTNE